MRIFVLIISLILLLFIDQASKSFFLSLLGNSQLPILGDILTLRIAYNTGIAFSIPLSGILLQFVTACVISYLLYFYYKVEYPKKSIMLDIGYVFILSGAFSHAYERIFIGHVVDFIDLKYFAIFNFADIFISVGAFLLLSSYVFNSRKYR